MWYKQPRALALVAALVLLVSPAARAQRVITLPPSGDNQKASVSQWIGLVKVTVDYSSPDVTSPTGEDRTGKIWGQLVPYGLANLGFGSCTECPWRAGANENTVFTVSHDVQIEGQTLPAGSYGLHMIPGEEEWTIIFSKNHRSWGSYYYDPQEDQLRVTVKPQPSEFHEWLTYEFTDRDPEAATATLKWEHLQVPFRISVPNMTDLYIANMRNELRGDAGFGPNGWTAAAQYALQRNTNLAEALEWAQKAAGPVVGQENFTTLSTLSRLQAANGMTAEAEQTMQTALNHPMASAFEVHQYGRQLISEGKKEEAVAVFELNAKRHNNAWPTNVGLARGYAAVGRYEDALKYAKLAVTQAPDDVNRTFLEEAIQKLEEGQDIN